MMERNRHKCWKVIIGLLCTTVASATIFASTEIEGIQVFQKQSLQQSEQRQLLADQIDRYHSAEDIWQVLRQEFSLEHYEQDPRVQEQITWFMTHQDFLLSSSNRAAPYLYYILQQVHKKHLPAEVVLLPIFESAYNPFAYSSAGAAGIWQMMPSTASGYGVKQNWWYDGRRDVITSTKAALTHLSYLGNFFDSNWLLAFAAYDTGEGNVMSAINKNIRDGSNTDYWSLPLARETKIYVPRLLALAAIIAHPEKYPVFFPPVRNAPYLAQIDIGSQINLQQAAGFAGLSLKKLMQLNPGYNRAITDPHGPNKLVLPIENVAQFTDSLAQTSLYQLPIQWEHYKTRSGDSLVALAKRYNTSPAILRKMNQLSSNHLSSGTNLVIPKAPRGSVQQQVTDDDQEMLAENTPPPSVARAMKRALPPAREFVEDTASVKPVPVELASDAPPQVPPEAPAAPASGGSYFIQPGDTIYMTRNGDTLARVAGHFHISPADLLAANPLANSRDLKADERLVIPTHLARAHKDQRYHLTPGDTIYMVRSGDTMDKIAKKFHTTPPEIRIANLIAENNVHEGDRLVIPTHA
jgi:membrane-bound lytic murein transglycosylase D